MKNKSKLKLSRIRRLSTEALLEVFLDGIEEEIPPPHQEWVAEVLRERGIEISYGSADWEYDSDSGVVLH